MGSDPYQMSRHVISDHKLEHKKALWNGHNCNRDGTWVTPGVTTNASLAPVVYVVGCMVRVFKPIFLRF